MGRYNTATAAVTLMVLVGLGGSACSSSSDDDSSSAEFAPMLDTDAPADLASGSEQTSADERSGAAESAGDALVGQSPTPLPTGQALATTAGVNVATPDIRSAVDDTLAAVQRNGASVFTADVTIGDEQDDGSVDGSGFFVVKVAPADLEPLITDLGATVGRLSGRTQDTTDVTDQLVDLDIRIGVERNVIDRFQNLLIDAAEFQEIIEIERVISERTIALEQLLAAQRNLDNRVDRSTLTIQLQYEVPAAELDAVENDSVDGVRDAWRTGWDVFVGALFAIGFVLAVAAPFAVTAALVFGVIWTATRRRRHTSRSDRRPSEGTVTVDNDDPAAAPVTPDEQLAGPSRRA